MSEERKFLIYMHTSPSGKSYIGQTCDIHRREIVHRNTDGCRAFANAIKKYGWDNFTHEILIDNLTLDEANRSEEELIAKYGTVRPGGYNLRTGGASPGFSDETRKKLSEAGKARKVSEAQRKKLSDLGKELSKERMDKLQEGATRARSKIREGDHPNKGRKHSAETRARMSAASKKALSSPEARAKMSAARTGVKNSEETKKKQSVAAIRRWALAKESGDCKWSTEARANHLKAREQGASVETKKKISDNSKLMWEKRRSEGLLDVSEDELNSRNEKRKAYRAEWARANRAKKKAAQGDLFDQEAENQPDAFPEYGIACMTIGI